MPGSDEAGQSEKHRDSLTDPPRFGATCQGNGDENTGQPACGETEKMGREVDAWTAASEHGDDSQSSGKSDPCSPSRRMQMMAPPRSQPRKDSDQTEDARRSANRAVGGAVIEGVCQIPECAGNEKAEKGEADTHSSGDGGQEKSAE